MLDIIKFLEVLEHDEKVNEIRSHDERDSLLTKMTHSGRLTFQPLVKWLAGLKRACHLRKHIRIPNRPPENLQVKIADSQDELEQAYALMQEGLVDAKLTASQRHHLRLTPQHALPSTVTIIIQRDHHVVAAATIVRDNAIGLPLESDYDVSFLRQRHNLAQVSEYAVNGCDTEESQTLALVLLKSIYAYCRSQSRIGALALTPMRQHRALLQSLLFFKDLSLKPESERGFLGPVPDSGIYLVLDDFEKQVKEVYQKLSTSKNLYAFLIENNESSWAKIPFMSTETRGHTTNKAIMTPALMSHFFQRETGLFYRLTPHERRVIANAYPFSEYEEALPQQTLRPESEVTRALRIEVDCDATLIDSENYQLVRAQALDVSRTGLRLKLERQSLQPLSLCRIRVKLNTETSPFPLEAKLVWNSGTTCGFEIQKAGPEWAHFCHQLETRFRQNAHLRQVHSH